MKNSEVIFEILKRAKEGDGESLNAIFNLYRSCIYIKANAFFIRGAERDDVLQEAMIGLLQAIKKYNRDLASFNTFASLCIQRQITTAIKTANSLKNLFFIRVIEKEDFNLMHENLRTSYHDIEESFINKNEIDSLYNFLRGHLSKFEQVVLSYLVSGYNYKEIAELLKKDKKIIDNSIQRIRKKSIFWLHRRK